MDLPCECMVIEQSDGSLACRQCRGDFYACECPVRHSIRCPEHPDFQEAQVPCDGKEWFKTEHAMVCAPCGDRYEERLGD